MATVEDFESLIEFCLGPPLPGVPMPQRRVVMADIAKYDEGTQALEAWWEGPLMYHAPGRSRLGLRDGGFAGVLVAGLTRASLRGNLFVVIAPQDEEMVMRIEGLVVPPPELEGDISLGEDNDPLDQTAWYFLPWPTSWMTLYPRVYYGP